MARPLAGQVDALPAADAGRSPWRCSPSRSSRWATSACKPAEGMYVLLARIFTVLYFAFFVLMPFYTRGESDQPRAGARDFRPCTEAAMQGRSMRGLMVLLAAFAVHGSVVAADAAAAEGRPRRGRRRELAGLDGRQRSEQHRVAAARRAQFRQLLPRLPLAEVHALLAHGQGSRTFRRAAARRA